MVLYVGVQRILYSGQRTLLVESSMQKVRKRWMGNGGEGKVYQFMF